MKKHTVENFEEFVEKFSWLWRCETAWKAYVNRADDDEGFYEFFWKRFRFMFS